jgi:hypothetical protein
MLYLYLKHTGSDMNEAKRKAGLIGGKRRRDKCDAIRSNYYKHANVCTQCNSSLDYDRRKNKFCSRGCAQTFNNSNRVHSQKTKDKISKSVSIAYSNASDEERRTRSINNLEARLASYKWKNRSNKKKPDRTCTVCGVKIYRSNKYDFCKVHYLESGVGQRNMGSYTNRFKSEWVTNPWNGSNVWLMSGLESEFVTILNDNNIRWSSPKYLPYTDLDGGSHIYFPDFYLDDYDIYIEVKGYMWRNDVDKMVRVMAQHTDKRILILKKKDIHKMRNSTIGSILDFDSKCLGSNPGSASIKH